MRELTANYRRKSSDSNARVLGNSPWARRIRAEIAQVASCTSTVLILGPTGTGKELIARCLHDQGARRRRPFVPVDCAAISGPLCASQLFGHVQGAFTGADYESLGCFRAAEGGTIFLDEVGELDPQIQAMLLRTLQERSVIPVGSHNVIPVDVRILAATNRALDREVDGDRFRLDLLYRLRVVSLQTVPLKDRPEDIPTLAENYLERLTIENGFPTKQLTSASLAKLRDHDWPGNVRELQNVLERAVVFCDNELIEPNLLQIERDTTTHHDSSLDVRARVANRSGPARAGVGAEWGTGDPCDASHTWPTLSQQEAEHIARTLEVTGYNQSAAARLLDIDRHLLARKMKKYGLRRPHGSD